MEIDVQDPGIVTTGDVSDPSAPTVSNGYLVALHDYRYLPAAARMFEHPFETGLVRLHIDIFCTITVRRPGTVRVRSTRFAENNGLLCHGIKPPRLLPRAF